MTNRFYRKDRFMRRDYFDSFPMNSRHKLIITHYIYQDYGCYFWEGLNKLIYKVASKMERPPSKVDAELLCIYIECRHTDLAELSIAYERYLLQAHIKDLGRMATKTGTARDLRLYMNARKVLMNS